MPRDFEAKVLIVFLLLFVSYSPLIKKKLMWGGVCIHDHTKFACISQCPSWIDVQEEGKTVASFVMNIFLSI